MVVSIILAAGLGKRMNSDLPKVLHTIHDKPLLWWVLKAAAESGIREHVVVVGHGKDRVMAQFTREGVGFVTQDQQLGTGHAVRCAQSVLGKERGLALILCGDTPCLRADTLAAFMRESAEYDVAVLSAETQDPSGYGRIVRDGYGNLQAIREHRDCSEKELQIREINTGIFAVRLPLLFQLLSDLSCQNSQGEYYLTDIIEGALSRKLHVEAFRLGEFSEFLGVNTPDQLKQAAQLIPAARAMDTVSE